MSFWLHGERLAEELVMLVVGLVVGVDDGEVEGELDTDVVGVVVEVEVPVEVNELVIEVVRVEVGDVVEEVVSVVVCEVVTVSIAQSENVPSTNESIASFKTRTIVLQSAFAFKNPVTVHSIGAGCPPPQTQHASWAVIPKLLYEFPSLTHKSAPA